MLPTSKSQTSLMLALCNLSNIQKQVMVIHFSDPISTGIFPTSQSHTNSMLTFVWLFLLLKQGHIIYPWNKVMVIRPCQCNHISGNVVMVYFTLGWGSENQHYNFLVYETWTTSQIYKCLTSLFISIIYNGFYNIFPSYTIQVQNSYRTIAKFKQFSLCQIYLIWNRYFYI